MLESATLKRLFDVAFAGAALVVAAPALAVLAAAIRLETPGPVLFTQVRVGRGHRPIRIFKLRTMVVDAERRGPLVTADRDPRITRVGRWLRKTKLDELPQLWNILRGEMSVVGPRPEMPRYVAQYRPEWQRLLTVRPGLTDLASLTFRDEERLLAAARDKERAYTEVILPLKLGLALEGIDDSSLARDLAIMVRTVLSVIRSRSADVAPLAAAWRGVEALNRTGEDA